MDYTVHGILQAIILEWAAIYSSRGSPQLRDQTRVSLMPDLPGKFSKITYYVLSTGDTVMTKMNKIPHGEAGGTWHTVNCT